MIRRVSFALLALVAELSVRSWTAILFIVLLPLTLLTGGEECLAQSQPTVSIFSNAVPADPVVSNSNAITLGVKFWSSKPGTISAIKFYRAATSSQGYVASLYSANGTLLGSVTMAAESGPIPGWQQAVFASPIPIAANTTYVAAYYAPTSEYAATPYGLTQAASNGPLNAPAASVVGGNGVYKYNQRFPTRDHQNTNYFVDVAFVPTETYLSITSNPPNPTIPSTTPLGATVAQITGAWSDGSPFTGTLSFAAPNFSDGGVYALDSNNNLIINPFGPGVGSAGGSTEYVTIVATQ
jgi:Domain of unknown function (DUF4082)